MGRSGRNSTMGKRFALALVWQAEERGASTAFFESTRGSNWGVITGKEATETSYDMVAARNTWPFINWNTEMRGNWDGEKRLAWRGTKAMPMTRLIGWELRGRVQILKLDWMLIEVQWGMCSVNRETETGLDWTSTYDDRLDVGKTVLECETQWDLASISITSLWQNAVFLFAQRFIHFSSTTISFASHWVQISEPILSYFHFSVSNENRKHSWIIVSVEKWWSFRNVWHNSEIITHFMHEEV